MTEKPSNPTTNNNSDNANLTAISMPKPTDPNQIKLELGISKQVEINGVGMGVLSNGTPWLTGRGLARLISDKQSRLSALITELNALKGKSHEF